MKKPRVVFAFTEAGLGHIMSLKSIADAFEKKYGDKVECVRSNFFSEKKIPALINFEKLMTDEVVKQCNHNWYGYGSTMACAFWGSKISSMFVMRLKVKDAFKEATKYVDELDVDLMVSTHWATNYYAMNSKSKPLTVMYCPDAYINPLFRYKCDLLLCSMSTGYNEAIKHHKIRFNDENIKLVPFAIRNEAFDIPLDKLANRKVLGIGEDEFVVTLAEGGYGIGKTEEIILKSVERDLPITLIALCGKNQEMYEKLSKLEIKGKTKVIPLPYTPDVFRYIASSNLFCGKSGNMIAEPCFYGVPQIITKHTNHIEKHIAEFYINTVKSAIKILNADKVVDKIQEFVNDRSLLNYYEENAKRHHDIFGSFKTADYLYELLKTKFKDL